MSFKIIELQQALPKTYDIGKIQNQLHQQSNTEQSMLMSQLTKIEIEKRKKTEKSLKSEMHEKNTTKHAKRQHSNDPNKGRFVDLEL